MAAEWDEREIESGRYLAEHGCAWGQVTRERVDAQKVQLDSIQSTLTWLLRAVVVELLAVAGYFVMHSAPAVTAWFQR